MIRKFIGISLEVVAHIRWLATRNAKLAPEDVARIQHIERGFYSLKKIQDVVTRPCKLPA